ncbi:MAG: FecR domain-containing protein [Verrucomicrobiota bacterium]
MAAEDRIHELVSEHLEGDLDESQRAELNELLRENPETRKIWRRSLELHARLHLNYSANALTEAMPGSKTRKSRSWRRYWPIAAAAAVLLLTAFLLRPSTSVATLVSNENAAWESQLPTTPGSKLTPGVMQLKAGVATIRFRSGAEVVLQAPAGLELKTPMRARLFAGSAAVDVPESANGFVLETPDGYAVDHGTAFAVSVDPDSRESSFEVLDGEISVHSADSSDSLRLSEQEAAAIAGGAVQKLDSLPSEGSIEQPDATIRIGVREATTVMRAGDPEKLHPDFLMTKLPAQGPEWERRSLLSFDVGEVDWESIQSAGLWLNLVPTGMGHAAYLETINQFSIYGVTDQAAESWDKEVAWEEAPRLDQAQLLGSFEIPRSVQTGIRRFESQQLLDFLKADADGRVTLIVIRDTPEVRGGGLVHAFASDTHPEASGPTLRLTLDEPN